MEQTKQLKWYAHRGIGFGLEGSLPAIREAMRRGFCYELDVRGLLTKELVVCHDPSAGRLRGEKTINFSQMRKEQFENLRFKHGNQVPFAYLRQIAEAMQQYPQAVGLWEIKEHGLVNAVMDLLKEYDLFERVVIIGFHELFSDLKLLADDGKGAKVGLIGSPIGMLKRAQACRATMVLTGYTNTWQELAFSTLARPFMYSWCKSMHEKRLEVVAGVVGKPGAAEDFGRWGFNGIISNTCPELSGEYE